MKQTKILDVFLLYYFKGLCPSKTLHQTFPMLTTPATNLMKDAFSLVTLTYYDTVSSRNANSKPPRKLEPANPLQSPPGHLFKSGMSCVVHGIFINLASQMREVSILTGSILGGKNPNKPHDYQSERCDESLHVLMVCLLLILLLELQWSKRVQERLRRLGCPLKKEAVDSLSTTVSGN